MPDICMCDGNKCPIKADCFRFAAKPSERQSFFCQAPYDPAKQTCEYLWQIKKPAKQDKDPTK